MFIDTHAHLTLPEYKNSIDEVIRRAFDSGVEAIIVVGTDLSTSQEAVELAEKHQRIFASVGVHPHDAQSYRHDIDQFAALCDHEKVVAIGEIGLDFYRRFSEPQTQERVLTEFIRLAKEKMLPVIIHCRQAHEKMLAILQEEEAGEVGGVFHCFSGGTMMATRVLEMGFHISFTGVITFKNFRASAVLKEVPITRLLLETDCPYMTPEPYRGQRNEPAYVEYIAKKMAQVKELSVEGVAKKTSQNARNLFRFDVCHDENQNRGRTCCL